MTAKFSGRTGVNRSSLRLKPILDRLVAAIALLVLSPVMLLVAIAIYIRIGRPIVFTQPRPGKDSLIFTFYKFRTMTDERDDRGQLLPDDRPPLQKNSKGNKNRSLGVGAQCFAPAAQVEFRSSEGKKRRSSA